MRLMVTGPQGSGKTTQVKLLSKNLGLCIVKVGDLLRERAKQADEISRKVGRDINQGILTDNQIVADILKEELSKPKCAAGFIVDGYPRSIEQLERFDPKYDLVIYLDLPIEESIKRLLARGREDDTLEAINKRLDWFEHQTKTVVEEYERSGKLIRVDGKQSKEKVNRDITHALNQHGQR